jgi:hypothetical protein
LHLVAGVPASKAGRGVRRAADPTPIAREFVLGGLCPGGQRSALAGAGLIARSPQAQDGKGLAQGLALTAAN